MTFGFSICSDLTSFLSFSMFGMVLEKLYIAEVQKVSGSTEKKICAVGMTMILTQTPAMLQGEYEKFW